MADAAPKENNPEALADVEQPQPTQPPVQSAPAPTEPAKTTSAGGAAKAAVSSAISAVSNFGFVEQTALLTILSAIELIAASVIRGQTPNAETQMINYSVAVGAISFFFSGVGFLVGAFSTASDNFRFFLAILLWSWWFAAAVALTFFGPFQSSGFYTVSYDAGHFIGAANGYYSTWAAFLVSCLALSEHSSRLSFLSKATEAASPAQALALTLFWTSAIVMGAGIQNCSPAPCYTYSAFGLTLGVVSMGLTLIFALGHGFGGLTGTPRRSFAWFLFVWWGVGTFVMTFGGNSNFVSSANGYYGSWLSFFFSFFLLRATGTAA